MIQRSTPQGKKRNTNISNPIVNKVGDELRDDKNYRKIFNLLKSNKVFGYTKSHKVDTLADLLALHETNATGMVLACDRISGFDRPRELGARLPPSGKNCDIYINGKKVGSLDSVDTTRTQMSVDFRTNTITGGDRMTIRGPIGTGRRGDVGVFFTLLKSTSKVLDKELGGVKGDFLFQIKNKVNPEGQVKTVDCKGKEEDSFTCVNWVRFAKKSDLRTSDTGKIIIEDVL